MAGSDDRFPPRISIELLYELGQITKDYNTWDKINSELGLGEDGHKVVRGMKGGRRSHYPSNFERSKYFEALGTVVMSYTDTLEALDIIRKRLHKEGLHIAEADALFARIDQTDAAQRADSAFDWWDELQAILAAHFVKSEDDVLPGQAGAARAVSIPGPTVNAQTATVEQAFYTATVCGAPTLMRLVKATVAGERPGGMTWNEALALVARREAPDEPMTAEGWMAAEKPVLLGRPMSDADFVARVFPQDFVAVVDEKHEDATAFLDADPAGGLAWDYLDFFEGDQGLRFSRVVGQCGALMGRADAGAFFARMDELFCALEQGARDPLAVRDLHSAFTRFAGGDAGRGLAFMVACALVGPENARAVGAIVDQPEVKRR